MYNPDDALMKKMIAMTKGMSVANGSKKPSHSAQAKKAQKASTKPGGNRNNKALVKQKVSSVKFAGNDTDDENME
jgi:hypothetical protein